MNPIFLDLGIVQIYWYSILIFIALLVGGALALREAKKFDLSEDFMINMFFYLIPIALIGARLYFVLFHFDYYKANPMDIFKVWEGGLAIHGALIAGLLWIIFYTHKHHIPTVRVLDILVVSLLLGQAIGRWGNFLNGEAYGPETTLSFLESLHLPQFIIDGMHIGGIYYQPTFLYESLWCLIGFIIILLFRKRKYCKNGDMVAFYLVWYGIGRFVIEGLRTDSLMLGSFKVAQIVSIIMVIIGGYIFFRHFKQSKLENLYREEEII